MSTVTEWPRSAAARTVDDRSGALGEALRAVTPGDLSGWFDQCGYRHVQEGIDLGTVA